MIKSNTVWRAFYTLAVWLVLSQPALAQSVLNFARSIRDDRQNTGITVTNPTPYYADVQFAFYGFDGNPVSSGLVNPVSYRIGPKAELSMLASEIFAATKVEGWIQATSSTSGLLGFYLTGDFTSKIEGSDASVPLSSQVVPLLREDESTRTDLLIINPGPATANVAITFFGARGEEISTLTRNLPARAASKIPMSTLPRNVTGANMSAKVSSSGPVTATAIIETGSALMFVNGQRTDQPATVRIAPHFQAGNGINPILILANPSPSAVSVTVTLFSESGGPVHPSLAGPSSIGLSIPGNGSVSVNAQTITRLLVVPFINGWLRIDSPNVALSGLVVLDSTATLTTVPLQATAFSRMLYSQVSETETFFTALALINAVSQTANVDVSLMNVDGATMTQTAISIAGNSKLSSLVRDLIPAASGMTSGFVLLRSSIPIYGIEMFGSFDNQFLATVAPLQPPAGYAPEPIVFRPRILSVEPTDDVRPGTTLRISTANIAGEVSVLIGGQSVPWRTVAPGFGLYLFEVPAIEPGFAKLQFRSEGGESAPVELRILPADNTPTQIVPGQAFYQKVEVTDGGLDLSRTAMVPVRGARVEVFDRSLQAVVSVTETDARGRFRVPVPLEPDLTVRVVSRMRSLDLRVADNTNNNALYSISADVDMREPPSNILMMDNSRVSGAFNILEIVQRGNDTVRLADPRIAPSPLTIFWSTRNTPRSGNVREGAVGMTFFSLANSTAFVLGDRSVDSDEFDDSVIAHEYAHLLAVRFSRDDSPGGPHRLGDMLDPRVAWSEGFANFFSSAVRNDPIYRDSMGLNGSNVLRYDLEENIPAGDRPGYWSEASAHGLLWDLYDERADTADNIQLSLSLIWGAFSDLRSERFVYLPYFLERFLARNAAAAEVLRTMAQLRSIDFQPNVRPSVTNPFPRSINAGDTVTGEVDSLTPKRTNLMQSSHFHSLATSGGAASIRLDIVGLGPADNPNANDLDLFLLDANGRIVDRSDRGLNGQSELVSINLPAGNYVVEVRSYYTRADTNGLVFNSGRYRLNVVVR